jgi:signal transduction histidine kinase
MQSSPPPLPAILSLLIGIALEWQAAPLALGSFSPAIAWAIALTGIPHLPLSWILVCLVCAIWARSVLCGYGWKDAALDIVPAALGVLVVSRLDLFSAVFCLLAIAFPLPWALSHGWGRSHESARSRSSLVLEHYAVMCLGLCGRQLAQTQWAWLVVLIAPLLSLLSQAQAGVELGQRRRRHYALTRAQGEVAAEQARQAEQKRLLDFRARAFAWLETLAARPLSEAEVLQQALALVRSLAGIDCQMTEQVGPAWQTHDQASWPIPGKGNVWLRSPKPWSSEMLPTLGVYFHYLGITLERVRFQAEILGSVKRLNDLLQAAHELSIQVEPRAILEIAVQRASQWVQRPTGARWNELEVGNLSGDLWLDGLNLSSAGLSEADLEALKLWSWLVGAALQRCQVQQGLLHNSKLAAIGQLAAGVAHELNTPLGSVTVALGLVSRNIEKQPEKALARLETANKSLAQMGQIVSKLLQFASRSEGTREPVDLAEIGNDSVAMVESSFHLAQVELVWELESVVRQVNAGEIQQILVNLLVNARLAVTGKEGAKVKLTLRQAGEFWVEDNGPGVPEEIQSRIFEPFFTTRDPGQGVGLGLSLAREMAQAHGGNLSLGRSASLGGAAFHLELP